MKSLIPTKTNQEKTEPDHFPFVKWLLLIVTIFLVLATAVGIFALSYAKAHQNGFYPGLAINGQKLTKLDIGQTASHLQNKVDEFSKQGLNYQYNGEIISVFTTLPATDPDVSYQLIYYKIPESIEKAYLFGRNQGYTTNFLQQMQALLFGKDISLEYEINQTEFEKVLKESLKKFTSPKTEARPIIDDDFQLTVDSEKPGTNFDYRAIMNASIFNIQNLSSQPIDISLIEEEPLIRQAEISTEILTEIENLLENHEEITLSHESKSFEISHTIFKDWLEFKKTDDQIALGLNNSLTIAYLSEEIAPEIYRPTQDAKFEIKNGKVEEFQGSQDGLELDLEKTYQMITEKLIENDKNEIELVVSATKSKIATADVNDLGITEILGTGHSNFKGSPPNRRHNIQVGADSLNGILIKPGETFSLLTALGNIDAAAGYLPELVIKGDRTIPEYGGGLCQIGTTIFRATLDSGLKIIERRNHSYRVSYYEPAGTDATIYDPAPDYKFLNDTENYILIGTRIEGDDLYFDFWGTNDGRVADRTEPVIYNIKSPGPTVYIETTDLAPGVTRCTESAHAGADAYFDYTVTYADGTVHNERFNSHYIPWQARCLVGKAPTPDEPEPGTPTSTEPVI